MDMQDRQAIEKLFSKLSDTEGLVAQRDSKSERFINERISVQPSAPYFMAPTIAAQEQALAPAEDRIRELECGAGHRPEQSGGFLSSIFGNTNEPHNKQVPSSDRPSPWDKPQSANGLPIQGHSGGGLLAGATQTAPGVTGSVVLGSALSGMFGGTQAKAAEPPAEKPAEETDKEQGAGMDLGFDDPDF